MPHAPFPVRPRARPSPLAPSLFTASTRNSSLRHSPRHHLPPLPRRGCRSPGGTPAPAIRFRPATPADMGTIQRLVLSEFMNPLSLDVRRFVVAEAAAAAAAAAAAGEGAGGAGKGEVEAGWRLVGAGQMKEWKPEGG
ncbi:hypothetical protein CLOP_g23491 [Closterium sp. NIES-67]|nr:hypothetical protein CLOP_g23491 [Closterium sp. NIES-67]